MRYSDKKDVNRWKDGRDRWSIWRILSLDRTRTTVERQMHTITEQEAGRWMNLLQSCLAIRTSRNGMPALSFILLRQTLHSPSPDCTSPPP